MLSHSTAAAFRPHGRPARRGVSAMRGLRASSGRTCWSCGSATSTAPAIPPSSAWKRPRRCSSASSMRSARTEKLVEPAYRQPPRLERVDVCSASGDLPNAECPQTVSTWYIPGVSPIRVSQVHRRVWIDTRTGEQACPPYDPTHTRSEVFEFWPTELLQLFAQAGMPRRRPPPAARLSARRARRHAAANHVAGHCRDLHDPRRPHRQRDRAARGERGQRSASPALVRRRKLRRDECAGHRARRGIRAARAITSSARWTIADEPTAARWMSRS